jgi:hypothetical protein
VLPLQRVEALWADTGLDDSTEVAFLLAQNGGAAGLLRMLGHGHPQVHGQAAWAIQRLEATEGRAEEFLALPGDVMAALARLLGSADAEIVEQAAYALEAFAASGSAAAAGLLDFACILLALAALLQHAA